MVHGWFIATPDFGLEPGSDLYESPSEFRNLNLGGPFIVCGKLVTQVQRRNGSCFFTLPPAQGRAPTVINQLGKDGVSAIDELDTPDWLDPLP